ncbi:MAG: hypothetical protein WC729_12790 [Sphingomonas sp.]|jgi:hypothetical protein|uniref:hypothetical protein n=1 Tax=Sphingomonas sp. TaxID=28214 RepID=UPI003561B4BE
MNKLFYWLTTAQVRYAAMSAGERSDAMLQTAIDLCVAVLLGFALVVGVTREPAAFLFLIPLFAVGLFFRVRQARERWGI